MATHGIGQTVVADIYHNKEVAAPDGIVQVAFGFPGAETGAGASCQKGVLIVALEDNVVSVMEIAFFAERYKIIIYLFRKISAAVQRSDF